MTLYKQNNLSYTPAKFAEAVAHLTLRYSEGYTHDPKHTIKWQDQISIPPKITHCLTQSLGLTQERFASPLNTDPSFANYSSIHIEDSAFGAMHDAYSRPWTGLSMAHPNSDHSQMNKAVRWAIGSALAHPHNTTTTVFFLPAVKGSPYTDCLTHPTVHMIDCIPGSQFNFSSPSHPLTTGQEGLGRKISRTNTI